MSKHEKVQREADGKWYWRNPKTGVTEGPFKTRAEGRKARQEAEALQQVVEANARDRAA